ncbi:MAG: NAD-dependent epimerase/dehydratase family protein [Azonexus sp.]|nr:NAD-dependent epimerase/dehydratase family protein [Azonexus sp.]
MQKILIVGSGDIARRILFRLHGPCRAGRYRIYALLREPETAAFWRRAGAIPLVGDLDDRASLRRLAGLADQVLHLAPPPGTGQQDSRTRHLLSALSAGGSLPRRLVYVSTTGIYGDCAGAWIDETRRCRPESVRAIRRVDAERRLREWGRKGGRRGVCVSILRAPGIYAADRLPLERLRQGLPVLTADEDVYSNHIHADDLAAACLAALRHGRANRVYNAVDDSDLRMADYFDCVADASALPRPPRLSRNAAAARLSPLQWSFMRESRRIMNRRLKRELKLRLAYPTVAVGIAKAAAGRNSCSS